MYDIIIVGAGPAGMTAALYALRANKKVLVFFSDDKDGISDKMFGEFLNDEHFIKTLEKDFALVKIEFSDARFKVVNDAESVLYDKEDATAEEKETAAKIVNEMLDDMNLARLYNVETTPGFFIVSKEGYIVKKLPVAQECSKSDFELLLADSKKDIFQFDADMRNIKKLRGTEKVLAIDAFFEKTPLDYRFMISDLSQMIVDEDPKNASGLVGKHMIVLANNRATDFFINQDADSASKEFETVAANPILTPSERQQTYYTAGYLLAQSGSYDYDRIKALFQKAYDAMPDSDYSQKLVEMIDLVSLRKKEFDEFNAQDGTVEEYIPPEVPLDTESGKIANDAPREKN